jgi:hypothetical protein
MLPDGADLAFAATLDDGRGVGQPLLARAAVRDAHGSA